MNLLRVLIVQADWPVAGLLAAALDDEGMVADIVEAGASALPRKRHFQPDVVVIGLGAFRAESLALVESFADEGDCGVVVVSVDDVENAHVASLDGGADDYIVEPVALRRVAARIRAVHRRLARSRSATRGLRIRVDVAKRGLIGPKGVTSTLTAAEFALLRALLEGEGASVSREWLGRAALKRELHVDDRSVDQLVLKLRRKLAQHGLAERAILSTRGLGYSIPDPELFELPRPVLSPAPDSVRMQPAELLPDGVPPAAMLPPPDASEGANRSAGAL